MESERMDHPLEISGERFQELLDQAGVEIGNHLDSLKRQPLSATENADDVLRRFDFSINETGDEFEGILSDLFDEAIPCSFNTASPGYLAYIPGGGLPQSAIADLISEATNRYMGVYVAAPVLATIEQEVIRWMTRVFGMGREAGGILTTGGSLANWTALVTARDFHLGEQFEQGVLYCSNQSHHCIEKAARLAGIRKGNIRQIGTDHLFRLDVKQLEKAIEEDLAAGKKPFLVASNAGTTNSGAVDPLVEIGELCKAKGLWFHVDAAYGGYFMLTSTGKKRLEGISKADSIVVDPHKGLFLPYGTGALLVKNVQPLRETHSSTADYLPETQTDPNRVDFNEISPELSRDFRGLRIWLPLKMHGIRAFRDNLDEKLQLIDWIASHLRDWRFEGSRVEIVAEPQLTVLAFRVLFAGDNVADPETLENWNRELLRRINARKRVMLTSTLLDGKFVIRICVLSFRTHLEHMKHCLEDIQAEIRSLSREIKRESAVR